MLNKRLKPSLFSSRYYPLKELSRVMIDISEKYILGHNRGVLVDFGCGSQPYRSLFDGLVSKYIGVDLPDNEFADITVSEDGKVDLPDKYADIVLSTQVLEHIPNPFEYLRECHRILNDDGCLILSTHGYWMYHPNPGDFWRWTGSGLTMLFQSSGFVVIEQRGVMGLAASGLQLLQDGVWRIVPRWLQAPVALVVQSSMGVLDKLNSEAERSRDAGIFVVVARKSTMGEKDA